MSKGKLGQVRMQDTFRGATRVPSRRPPKALSGTINSTRNQAQPPKQSARLYRFPNFLDTKIQTCYPKSRTSQYKQTTWCDENVTAGWPGETFSNLAGGCQLFALSRLFDINGRAGAFELFLDFFSLFLCNTFLDLLGRHFDQILGLF